VLSAHRGTLPCKVLITTIFMFTARPTEAEFGWGCRKIYCRQKDVREKCGRPLWPQNCRKNNL